MSQTGSPPALSRQRTSIGWTDFTWNWLVGCTKVSPGCDNCYAERIQNRFHKGYEKNKGRNPENRLHRLPKQFSHPFSVLQVLPERLNFPATLKHPSMIFVNSMSDVWHPDVPDEVILQAWEVMVNHPQHIFQVLTKRILSKKFKDLEDRLTWAENIWLGVSCETPQFLNRIERLKQTQARVKFVSLEPLLAGLPTLDVSGLDWVIAGCESGYGARPMEEDWVLEIRDKCIWGDVPFFYKQSLDKTGRKNEHPLLEGREWKQFPPQTTKLMGIEEL